MAMDLDNKKPLRHRKGRGVNSWYHPNSARTEASPQPPISCVHSVRASQIQRRRNDNGCEPGSAYFSFKRFGLRLGDPFHSAVSVGIPAAPTLWTACAVYSLSSTSCI